MRMRETKDMFTRTLYLTEGNKLSRPPCFPFAFTHPFKIAAADLRVKLAKCILYIEYWLFPDNFILEGTFLLSSVKLPFVKSCNMFLLIFF